MKDCDVNLDLVDYLYIFTGAVRFETFAIHNVSFEGIVQQQNVTQRSNSPNSKEAGLRRTKSIHIKNDISMEDIDNNSRSAKEKYAKDQGNFQIPFQEMTASDSLSKPRKPSSSKHKSRNSSSAKNITITECTFKNFDIKWKFDDPIERQQLNVELYQNTLKESSLNIKCTMECHIHIDSHRHYASSTILVFYRDGEKSKIKITNTSSTGQNMKKDPADAHLDIAFTDKVHNSKVTIEDCVFGDSNIVGVSVRNVAEVYILNTNFYNIHMTDLSGIKTDIRAAAGVTIISTLAQLHNIIFTNVSAVSCLSKCVFRETRYALQSTL